MAVAERSARDVIQMLEQERFIILGQAVDSRTELPDLEAIDQKLTRDLRRARRDLSKEASGAVVFQTSRGSRSYQPKTSSYDAANRLCSLKKRIREIPQFLNFLRPVVDDGLLELSQTGALVYLTLANVQDYGLPSSQGGFAFLLHHGQFQTVKLPNLSLTELKVKSQKFT